MLHLSALLQSVQTPQDVLYQLQAKGQVHNLSTIPTPPANSTQSKPANGLPQEAACNSKIMQQEPYTQMQQMSLKKRKSLPQLNEIMISEFIQVPSQSQLIGHQESCPACIEQLVQSHPCKHEVSAEAPL